MTQPLVLLYYEKLLPGSQLVNRLQDLDYRVQVVTNLADLAAKSESEKPMLVLMDLLPKREEACQTLALLKKSPATSHVPIVTFATEDRKEIRQAALDAGATLLVTDTAISVHLKQLLDQVLASF